MDLFTRLTVCDFLLEKDPLFARLTLSGEELHPVSTDIRLAQAASPEARSGHLPPGAAGDPVRTRAPARRRIRAADHREYLALLADSYSRFFYHYSASPVLIVNSERLNFVRKDDDLDLLIERAGAMRGNREFFNWGD